MQKTAAMLMLLLANLCFAQNTYLTESESVPTYNGSSRKLNKFHKLEDIASKTISYIAQKTDSVFLRRFGLKENDSIAFDIKYVVRADGTTPIDSVDINTGIKSFDNYIKLLITSLPKFIPAINAETGQPVDFRIAMEARLTVQGKKLVAVEPEKMKNLSSLVFVPCSTEKSEPLQQHCSLKLIGQTLQTIIEKYEIPEGMEQLRFILQFSVDESGNVGNAKVLRAGLSDQNLIDELLAAIYKLPKVVSVTSSGKPAQGIFTLPINIQVSSRTYERAGHRVPSNSQNQQFIQSPYSRQHPLIQH